MNPFWFPIGSFPAFQPSEKKEKEPKRPATVLDEDEEIWKQMVQLPHDYLQTVATNMLKDPALGDIQLEDLNKLDDYDIQKKIDESCGRGVKITLVKHTGERIPLVIIPSTTLEFLQRDIEREINREQSRASTKKLSWKYIWKNYCIMYKNTRVLNKFDRLMDLGIRSGDEIIFAKYRRRE
eukprot:TRINITY_DN25213_c0_g1_i1.p1 TRINITY_DN25213_c0_g1~~TRINITY_DN25213_c0_g1_i1.p1  ORF type:complete len:181 (-),score=32.81 TRINITY_DN25213_c0_g1_i1:93-635(-)